MMSGVAEQVLVLLTTLAAVGAGSSGMAKKCVSLL
jgi:hypothetical protein